MVAVAGISKLREFVARRVTAEIDRQPQAVDALVKLLARPDAEEARQDILNGMSVALRGWRQATLPAAWATMHAAQITRLSNRSPRYPPEICPSIWHAVINATMPPDCASV